MEKLIFENFNDVIFAYRKCFRKSCCSIIYAEFSPLFIGANCAYILSTAVVKLYFENFNDVICAYRKYFRKSCWSLIDAELRINIAYSSGEITIVNNPPYRDLGRTANQEVIKMWYTNIFSKIRLYQKYLGTSIKVGYTTHSIYASSGPKAEGVPSNNQRGRGPGPCRLWGGLDNARHIVPTALWVTVQCWRTDLHRAVEGPIKYKTYGLLDDLWVILSTSKAFDNVSAWHDKIRFAFDHP